ncbi:MAG TPA: hypothetical protein VF439_01535 [Candidatus Paceibacterota bacterium]
MSSRQRALAQPQGRERKKPGTAGRGAFYRIEIRPKAGFTSFRTQDVGKKGGLERIAGRRPSGRRPSGSWATAVWLVSKKNAHMTPSGRLVIDTAKERASLKKAIRGRISHVKEDIFSAHPARNIPEREKPTRKMRLAQMRNIKKAQAATRK